ncbi:hypothetical protein [Bacillus taeanensis]|uniref:Uncharacterized protein n=1 Tax=Bacillus taeanensis TaxID=273032 RepID=A0A366XU73_9BACI|nr:hypothetical protein [Bacillus taeanensis]RBW67693.1 hypothetical protein DS031_20690 [Bacillus taeanensis]
MHSGDEVYITKTGKYYHYLDDSCLITARIVKGNMKSKKVLETEAQRLGYTLCRQCAKNMKEDTTLVEKQKDNSKTAPLLLMEAGLSFYLFSYKLVSGAFYKREK